MMKKISMLVLLIMFCIFASVSAADVNVIVDGELLVFDTQPIIENDRTFIAIRQVSECLNYDVSWDEGTSTVKIMNDNSVLKLKIGDTSYIFNDEEKKMDTAPFIKEGRTMVPLRFVTESFGCTVDWEQDSRSVIIKSPAQEQQIEVVVSTAKELLENIKSNTTIILNDGIYNLSEVNDIDNKSVTKSDVFDGYEYIINSVRGLEIKAADNAEVTVVVEPRYANVLRFNNCSNITMSNIIAGHTIEEGYCIGGVIRLDNTDNTSIKNCKFYGCGTYGIIGDNSDDTYVSDTDIYECTYGAVDMSDCSNANFNSCIFRDCNGFSLFDFRDCHRINIVNSIIKDNENGTEYSSFISGETSKDIVFSNCSFENNKYQIFTDSEDILFDNCKMDSEHNS